MVMLGFYRRYWPGWRRKRILLMLAAVALLWGLNWLADRRHDSVPQPELAGRVEAVGSDAVEPDRVLAEAFRERRSNLWVEGAGTVERTLPDDREGSPHQRFILRLASGQTLLVAHNLELAPRVPLRPGDRILFRGQYEWNERGGVLHWTHDHPAGGSRGWIEHRGRRYE
jgi:hypothetical protein